MAEEVLQALVAHVAGEEMTVFFSSHQIAEVDQIADRIAIIDRGRTLITGALRPGEQLPGIRPLAEELVINPNTVAKAYRELEHEGVIELRHGAGAFVSGNARAKKLTDNLRAGQALVSATVEKLRARGVTDEEIRRLFEADLAGLSRTGDQRG